MSGKTALLIVDVQQGMFSQPEPPHRGQELLDTLAGLIFRARAQGVAVIYVQHEGGDGHPLAPTGPGWPIHPAIAPAEREAVIRKEHSDAFHETQLEALLGELGVTRLVIAGMQTEYCVDTTCRRAFSLGYQVVLVADGHTTWNTDALKAQEIIAHHNQVLGDMFARLLPSNDVVF
jgi:nicotinamidase-related amidase